MRAKIVKLPTHSSSPPHCCIVTGRRDRPVVDFGDPTPKAQGPGDQRVYISASQIEWAARELLGMVPQGKYDERGTLLEEANAERDRLAALVAGGEELSAAEDKMREALGGPAPTPEGS